MTIEKIMKSIENIFYEEQENSKSNAKEQSKNFNQPDKSIDDFLASITNL